MSLVLIRLTDQMQIRLEVGARTAPTILIPFSFIVVEFDNEGVVLSLGGESEVRIEFDDWAIGLAAIGSWRDEEYVIQSGGENFVEVPPVERRSRTRPSSPVHSPPSYRRVHSSPISGRAQQPDQVFVFFRAAQLEETRDILASYNSEDETQYDDRFGLKFKASSSDKMLWTVSDPFAGVDLSTVTTRDDDLDQQTGEVVFHGNAKYYIVRGLGEVDETGYGIRVSEAVFAPEDLNRSCKACEEPEEE